MRITLISIIVVGLILLVFGVLPTALLWCVNTLFNTNNPYDITHWFAALLFLIIMGDTLNSAMKKVNRKADAPRKEIAFKTPPPFVHMGHRALRLDGDRYYRDAGNWEVNYVWHGDKLYSRAPSHAEEKTFLNGIELIKISEQAWQDDNYGHTHSTRSTENI